MTELESHFDVIIRPATVHDVKAISDIINYHANKGIMLARPISKLYDNVRDYTVIVHESYIVGCGALHVVWEDLAEIRSVAMRDGFKGKGYGKKLIERLMQEARLLDVENIFVLTYQDKFFAKLGFKEINKSELPHKIWSECVNCIHFPNCDEIAMIQKTPDS